MTEQEINVAIAEWMGRPEPCGDCDPCCGSRPDQCAILHIPDYCHDFNAMHEAQAKLLVDDVVQRKWEVALYRIIRRDSKLPDNYLIEMYRCMLTTAAQRAEALLKMIGKWKEHTK